MRYGYIRCSTKQQDYSRQQMILSAYNLDKIFEEKVSGTKTAKNRPVFEALLKTLKEGDTIYFESMSRLARSIQDLISTTQLIAKEKKCTIIYLKENLTIGGAKMEAMSELLFNIMGSFAQFERDLIADRTKQGLEAKKQQGVHLGRKFEISEETKKKAISLRKKGLKFKEISDITGVSITRIYEFCNEA